METEELTLTRYFPDFEAAKAAVVTSKEDGYVSQRQ
jgi:hypothetical protein